MNNKEEILQILSRMQSLCSKTEKSSGEIRQKLKSSNLLPEETEEIIQSLQNDKFIDDRRFAGFFCRDKFKFNQWGKIKIRQALYSKGISEEICNESLDTINQHEYLDVLDKLLKNKDLKLHEPDIFKRKARLFRFAAQKGFEAEYIYAIIDKII